MTGAAVRSAASCWRCGAEGPELLACGACDAPQPIAPAVDGFGVLGVPRRLSVDLDDLEARYHEAARRVHPDRHQTSDARARALSLEAGAAVNRAYRTLRDAIARGRYWLELHGRPLGDANNRVPPALAQLVFDTQEQLEELREKPDDPARREAVAAADSALRRRVAALEGALRARYDAWGNDAGAAAALAELKERLSEIAYLRTLAADVEEALER